MAQKSVTVHPQYEEKQSISHPIHVSLKITAGILIVIFRKGMGNGNIQLFWCKKSLQQD